MGFELNSREDGPLLIKLIPSLLPILLIVSPLYECDFNGKEGVCMNEE